MVDLKSVIAENLYELRCAAGLTQLSFAEKLNYSDKAVSKWERAESVPDIYTLKMIADMYGVTVDYLLTRDHPVDKRPDKVGKRSRRIRVNVSLISVVGVWLVATLYFAMQLMLFNHVVLPAWMAFIYAIPVSSIVAIVFNSIWGRRKFNFIYISTLVIFSFSIISATISAVSSSFSSRSSLTNERIIDVIIPERVVKLRKIIMTKAVRYFENELLNIFHSKRFI